MGGEGGLRRPVDNAAVGLDADEDELGAVAEPELESLPHLARLEIRKPVELRAENTTHKMLVA